MALKYARSSRRTFLLILGLAALVAAASPARKKNYPIPGHGTLELKLPAGLGDLLADQPPAIRILPAASRSSHVPVTALSGPASAVHVPANVRPASEDAVQEPCRSAPQTRIAVAATVARRRLTSILSM